MERQNREFADISGCPNKGINCQIRRIVGVRETRLCEEHGKRGEPNAWVGGGSKTGKANTEKAKSPEGKSKQESTQQKGEDQTKKKKKSKGERDEEEESKEEDDEREDAKEEGDDDEEASGASGATSQVVENDYQLATGYEASASLLREAKARAMYAEAGKTAPQASKAAVEDDKYPKGEEQKATDE